MNVIFNLILIFFRQKQENQSEGILIHSVQNGLALEFERSDSTRRLRLVLSEILGIASQVSFQRVNQPAYSQQFLKLLVILILGFIS